MAKVPIKVTVNGEEHSTDVEPRMLLVHFIRESLRLTGTHIGCDTSHCGACTVVMGGRAIKSCTVFAIQADGRSITTVEGLEQDGKLHPLQDGFFQEHGLQCGFCTPGMLMTGLAFLKTNSDPSDDEIRHAISGNLCRCTGYVNIVKAYRYAAQKMREGGEMSGSLGTPELDAQAQTVALDLMRKRASSTISLGPGSVSVFFEVHGPPPTLIVFGAGHVAMPLVSLAHDLGLKTIVVDGRPRFATRERFPDVDQLLIGIPSEIAETLAYTSSTFVVLTAHDYKYDLPVLKVVLPARPAYVGLLGSKRRGMRSRNFFVTAAWIRRCWTSFTCQPDWTSAQTPRQKSRSAFLPKPSRSNQAVRQHSYETRSNARAVQ